MMFYSMKNHLFYYTVDDYYEDSVKLKKLRNLIIEDRSIDQLILEKFPIENFGNFNDLLKIKGSKQLIETFEKIDAKKLDIPEKLENIEFIGFTDKNEIILKFINENITASSIYSFSSDFLEQLFSLDKYANFCYEHDYHDLLKENIDKLFKKMPKVERQFRLVEKNDQYFLRAQTSTKYNNYDNHLGIYLILLALHKYCVETNSIFRVEKANLSDSEIRIYMREEKAIEIPDVGRVYFGALVSNSEIKDSALSVEIRYKVIDANNPGLSFTAIQDLRDAVIDINHTAKIETVEKKLLEIFSINKKKESMLEFIKGLSKIKFITSDTLYLLYTLITNSRTLKEETRKNFRTMYDKNIINNTLSLIEAFNLTSTISSDLDEKMYLERIYHRVLSDIIK